MKSDKAKLNFIVFCGFVSTLTILAVIGFILFCVISITKSSNTFTKTFKDNWIVLLIILIVFIVFDLISTICIWAIKWESDFCKQSKVLYGILNIVFPFLIPFIFSHLSELKVKKENQEFLLPPPMDANIELEQPQQPPYYILVPNNYNNIPQWNNYHFETNQFFQQFQTMPNNMQYPDNNTMNNYHKNNNYDFNYEDIIPNYESFKSSIIAEELKNIKIAKKKEISVSAVKLKNSISLQKTNLQKLHLEL